MHWESRHERAPTVTVLAVGAYTVDFYIFGDRLPSVGETVAATGTASAHGGKAANVAVAAARLGGRARFIGAVGGDQEGAEALATLARDGVDVSACPRTDPPTARSFICLDSRGQQYIMTWAGAADGLTADVAAAGAALLRPGAVLVLQGEIPVAVSAAAAAAAVPGVTVVLNPSPVEPFTQPRSDPDAARLLARADLVVLNAAECRRLIGERADSTRSGLSAEAAQLRRQIRTATVVVTVGAQGALVIREGSEMHVPAPEVKVVDTTGAGDGFVGALAAGIAAGMPLAEAVLLACRAAAVSVTRQFCIPSYPRASELSHAPLSPRQR
ncbi:PfkB family carbohydrate kinase [Verrucosispora sp. WMMD703]|uniref:PfkB family carbohydrate kinase n=1 Tax=Verrucosispora sp. WMMD703 TaxID=3403463 RepID=UPI003B92FCDE